MELFWDYASRGIYDTFFSASGSFDFLPILMVLAGLVIGIVVGATPGLNGPFAMAVALPILISFFGVSNEALLPILGFLVGVMKGGTLGGAVPAILFNTPGTPDAFLTTLDGHPMAQRGEAKKALRIAHFSSVAGDTFSDIVLFVAAPTLAVLIERTLDLPEKSALIVLSLSFMAVVAGRAPIKGVIVGLLGMILALIGTSLSGYGARMTLGVNELGGGLPLTAAILGVLVLGEVFAGIEEEMARGRTGARRQDEATKPSKYAFGLRDVWELMPRIGTSAVIGTVIGALPGLGTTLAAALGYFAAKRRSKYPERFGKGSSEGLAATEAANSAVSGANLIPVLSLGIPGNFAAVFIILAVDSVGDFTLGPSLFRFTEIQNVPDYGLIINQDLVTVFSIFALMVVANILNWTVGWWSMQGLGVMSRIPKRIMFPVVLLVTMTSVYAQEGSFVAIGVVLVFGLLGYILNRLRVSVLPFVIGFVLSPRLEEMIRGAYTASGNDPYFWIRSPIAMVFLCISVAVVVLAVRKGRALGVPQVD